MNTLGYIALALMAAIATLSFVAACACVGLYFKFHDEPVEERVGWRETVFGDAERGS